MNKNFIIILISLFSLLGCSNDEKDITRVKFWAMGAEAEYVSKLIPGFEKENPDIKVVVQQIPWTAAQEKLISAFASDNMPDACQLGNTWIPQFVSLDAIESLDKWIRSSQNIADTNYFEGIWNTNVIEDKCFGLPWYIDTRVLFYRKDVLEKADYNSPPKSWKELYDLSGKIKKQYNDEEKYAIYLPTNEWATFIIFALQKDASILKDNGCYGNFSSPKFKEAFDYLVNYHKNKLAPVGISQVNNVYQAFADGYFSMYISGPWNIREFKRWMKDDLEDQWMTAPLPGPKNSYPGTSLAGGSSLVMFRNSKYKKEVWRLFEYLSRPEIQIEFYKLINDLPSVKTAWQDSILANDKYMDAFYKQFYNVKATPKIAEWEQIAFSKLQQYAEYAARGVMTTDEALKHLDEDVDVILEKRRWLLDREE